MALPETLTDNGPIDRNFRALKDLTDAQQIEQTALATVESLTAATLNANWSTGTGRAAASYYKDRGRVWLQGGVKRDSGATTSPFTLPSGYRPTQTGGTVYAIVDGAGAVTYATVSTAGVLTFGAVTTGTALNLDGISFRI